MAHRHYVRTEKGGRWSPSFTDAQFINTLGPIEKQMTCRQIAKQVGCSVPLAQIRLKKLHTADEIIGIKAGHTWLYWQMPEKQ